MRSKFLSLPIVVFLLAFFAHTNVFGQENLKDIYWRSIPHSSPNVSPSIELALNGKPTKISVRANEFLADTDKFLESLITSECGLNPGEPYWTSIYDHARDLNKDAEKEIIPTVDGFDRVYINIPFCFKQKEQVEVKLGDTVDEILLNTLEGVPSTHYDDIYKLNKKYFDKLILNREECDLEEATIRKKVRCGSRYIREGDIFSVPRKAEPKDFFFSSRMSGPRVVYGGVSAGVSPRIATSQIDRFLDTNLGSHIENRIPDSNIIGYVSVDKSELNENDRLDFDNQCSGEIPLGYPYNEEFIWNRLAVEKSKMDKLGIEANSSKIGIIDSGVVFNLPTLEAPLFPDSLFVTYGSLDAQAMHRDFQRYGKSFRSSSNPKKGGYILPFQSTPRKDHGTEVAHLIFGGPNFKNRIVDQLTTEGEVLQNISPIKLRVFSLNSRPHEIISAYHFSEGVEYLSKRRTKDPIYGAVPLVNMINISAAQTDSDGFLRSKLADSKDYREVLFVVGAGNDTEKLSVDERYPASLGGGSSSNIMTVGAHGMNGNILPFSGRGIDAVDILAPGCNIYTISSSGRASIKSGTSYSAPLVTFTAGLITYLNPDSLYDYNWEPQKIKNRILYSADYSKKLSNLGHVRFGAILNIGRAISVRSNVLTVDGEMFIGEIAPEFIKDLKLLCADSVGFKTKRFILTRNTLDKKELKIERFFVTNRGNVSKDDSCNASDKNLERIYNIYFNNQADEFQNVKFEHEPKTEVLETLNLNLSSYTQIDLLLSE